MFTPDQERTLIDDGVIDASGYVLRRKVREAWERIAGPMGSLNGSPDNADRFILMLHRQARRWGIHFEDACARLGY